jgi:pyruvate carboxylase
MASKLKPNATIAEINKFLSQLRISNFYVHPRLVEFNDSNDRQRKIILLCNKLIAKGLPKAVAQAQSEELADADTISVGIKSLKQTGSVLMLAGLEEKDLQQRLPAEASTHVMLVFLKEKKVSILFTFIFIHNTNSYTALHLRS